MNRYVTDFTGRQGMREQDTIYQMHAIVAGMIGKRLMYRTLIADNGLESGARKI